MWQAVSNIPQWLQTWAGGCFSFFFLFLDSCETRSTPQSLTGTASVEVCTVWCLVGGQACLGWIFLARCVPQAVWCGPWGAGEALRSLWLTWVSIWITLLIKAHSPPPEVAGFHQVDRRMKHEPEWTRIYNVRVSNSCLAFKKVWKHVSNLCGCNWIYLWVYLVLFATLLILYQ